ncbi:hypothetical protein T07_13549 [Trichinella nelsoni]|uniref:Uncharacterized protein n=1 Tax=Trichinella nelsoni TaxID=6336 RepID=A0A0V0RF80_9BILA|nr:hypothetical protein T07_13549 [Trichinella nelsoni]
MKQKRSVRIEAASIHGIAGMHISRMLAHIALNLFNTARIFTFANRFNPHPGGKFCLNLGTCLHIATRYFSDFMATTYIQHCSKHRLPTYVDRCPDYGLNSILWPVLLADVQFSLELSELCCIRESMAKLSPDLYSFLVSNFLGKE